MQPRIRGLAKMRGRNADWAEQAVRAAASLPAEEALSKHVIDLIAIDRHVFMVFGKCLKLAFYQLINLFRSDIHMSQNIFQFCNS